ncbi:MAG: cytochrome b/b6 domain-containing protein [Candidatus Thiodiazotropha sp.]
MNTDTRPKLNGVVRLTKNQRIQHAVLFISTGLLIITGFMLQGEKWVIEMFGSAGDTIFWWRSLIHRIAGVTVTIICIYHIFYIAFIPEGRSWIQDMLPTWKDFSDLYQNLGYMLGFKDVKPAMDRFTYLEKLEYFSVWFGMFIVITTGVMMWTEYMWPKFYLDIANAFHLGEATLAALAIIAGHIFTVHYHPHVYPMNRAFINGYIDEELAQAEYPLWYKKLKKQ